MASTCIGIKVGGGIVLATEKLLHSKLLIKHANKRINTIDLHIGMLSAGLQPDSHYLANLARGEAAEHARLYASKWPGKHLCRYVQMVMQVYTMYGSVRPLGITSIFGMVDANGPQLYMVEPSGKLLPYKACAAGKGTRNAKNELEKLDFAQLTLRDAVKEAARM